MAWCWTGGVIESNDGPVYWRLYVSFHSGVLILLAYFAMARNETDGLLWADRYLLLDGMNVENTRKRHNEFEATISYGYQLFPWSGNTWYTLKIWYVTKYKPWNIHPHCNSATPFVRPYRKSNSTVLYYVVTSSIPV